MLQPILTFRTAETPYDSYSQTILYSETVAKQTGLPILNGDDSDIIVLRLYNNFGNPPAADIATAYNLQVTTFDSGALTASTPPVSGMWIYFQENGYGENSTIPGLYTVNQGDDLAVGGLSNVMIPPFGSDGTQNSYVRAGTNNAGVGFIELNTHASIPTSAASNTYNFQIAVTYAWNT